MSLAGNPWSYAEYDYVYKHYSSDGPVACAEHLGRPVESVNSKAEKLGISINGDFTDTELQYARSYGSILKGSLMFLLPHRTSNEIEELIRCGRRKK